jgi:hypothetical protein
MSTDPVIYDDKMLRPSLCRACIDKQNWAMLLTGYCVHARCTGCGEIRDLAMVKLNQPLKQNRDYLPDTLMVRATLTVRGVPSVWEFNWNDRDSVRRFAADSDRCIRAGGTSHLEQVK